MSGVRKPKDEEERALARIAIQEGKGFAMEEFIEHVLGYRAERQFVNAVVNRLELSIEDEDELDLVELINVMKAFEESSV
ncbi:MAG: hypothetical protein CMA63_07720 [Euryarchaeota archaeon]|nr:hypothetical protein [Euryarchaeota archaeon]|tara:strand:- start:8523 stop:8762 length:240 start_codon:yes stop_codon:yes gene_type:complete